MTASTTTPRSDRRTERAAATRAERRATILAGARRVFAAKGFHDTSVSDIVQEAGVARGTFYLYFESKSTVYHALLDELLGELRRTVRGVDSSANAAPITTQIRAIVRQVLATLASQRDLARILFRDAVGVSPEVDEKLDSFYSSLESWVARSLENGIALGFLRPIDSRAASACLVGAVKHVVETRLLAAPSITLARTEKYSWPADRDNIDALAESIVLFLAPTVLHNVNIESADA